MAAFLTSPAGDAKADPFRLPLGDLFLQFGSLPVHFAFSANEDSMPGGPQCQFDILAAFVSVAVISSEMKLAVAGMVPNTELSVLAAPAAACIQVVVHRSP